MDAQRHQEWVEGYARVLYRLILEGKRSWRAMMDDPQLERNEGWCREGLHWLMTKEYVNGYDALMSHKLGYYLPTDTGRTWWASVLSEANAT